MTEIIIRNEGPHALPTYATEGAAGMDIRSWLKEPVLLQPLDRIAIPTGLYLQIPEGYEGQVRPRSGLALNFGITLLNSPGTIDSDYRGELKVILVNLSEQPCIIRDGERIAQLVFAKVERVSLKQEEHLSETERGHQGFGSTGLK
jgi:dUTP pyrophosphatase